MPIKLHLSEVDQLRLVEDYRTGTSLRKLEQEYGHCRRVLSNILKEFGVGIRDNTENSRKFHHNEDFFEVIDTEPKAYWLGFLYADGFLDKQNHIGITLNSKDARHLEKFKSSLSATNPIHLYVSSGYADKSEFARILLKSKKMKQDLINKGMLEQKTLILEFPTQVPSDLIKHFIRGYLDGDGAISCYELKNAYAIGFTGTLSVIEGIRDFFNGAWSIRPNKNAFQMNIGGNKQVLRILHHLYDEATVFLDRKHDKFIELHSKYSES